MSGGRLARGVLVVLRKELIDSIRDRRTIWSIVFGVMIGPVLITFMMSRAADRQREAEEVRIPVVGMDAAPALVDWLRQQRGVDVVAGPDDPEAAVRDRVVNVVVVIAPDFADRFRVSRPARVEIVADSSRGAARPSVERVRRLLQGYSAEIGTLRLVSRGVSPAVATPLQLEEIDVSSSQQRAAQVLAFIPLLLVVAAFSGGMAVAIDATAGERERRSLEALLVNPAPRLAVVAGKWLATAAAAMAAVMLTTALCMLLPRFLPLQEMGIRFRFGSGSAAGILAAVLPLCLLLSALQIWVATFARSTKEAQSYLGFLMIVPMLPAIMTSVAPLGGQLWTFAVPMLGSQVLLAEVFGGRPPAAWAFTTAAAVSLAAAGGFVHVTTRLFRNERIVFGR